MPLTPEQLQQAREMNRAVNLNPEVSAPQTPNNSWDAFNEISAKSSAQQNLLQPKKKGAISSFFDGAQSALDKASGLFSSTAKFVGGAAANIVNTNIANSKEAKGMEESDAALTEVDNKAIQKARELNAKGDKAGAEKLLKVVQSHGKNITLNDILLDSQQTTAKEIAGGALGTVAEVGSFASGGPASKFANASMKETGVLKGAYAGTKEGVKVGAGFGAATSGAEAMQENKNLKEVVHDMAGGALEGALYGGVAGAFSGGVSGGLNKRNAKALEAESKRSIDAITLKPNELTPTEYGEYARQGKINPKSGLKEASIIPEKRDIELAEKYKKLLQSEDPVKNINNVMEDISQKDLEVGNYLADSGIKYDRDDLRVYLNDKVKNITDLSVANEKRLKKLKSDLVDELVNKSDDGQLYSLWKDRKGFDKWIENKLNAFGGSPTLKKELATEIRNGAQEYITHHLGVDFSGNSYYKQQMKDMSELFGIAEKIERKATKEKAQSALKLWMKENPKKYNTLKWGLGLGFSGWTGAKLAGE